MFWKRAGFKGGEREIDLLVHAHCIISPFLLFSLLSFFLSLVFFYFFLLLYDTLCFSIPFSGHDKGPFIVPAVTRFYHFAPSPHLSDLGILADHQRVRLCATQPCQTKAGLFHSLVHRSTLSCHDVNAFSLFPSWHAPNSSPLNLASFGWSVIPAGCTSQKGLGQEPQNRSFPLFSPPNHTPLTSYL